MAIPIKDVPVLTGELAENFIRRAEENERKPRWSPDPTLAKKYMAMLERSKHFIPSWMKD